MSTTSPGAESVTAARGLGSVEVALVLPRPVPEVWQAIADRDQVAAWFGTLSEPLREGGSVRLDFGDGDFFTLQDVCSDPPQQLQYAWRFLGIGPLDTITWRIAAWPGGSRLTVTDEEPGRSPEAGRLMRQGWLDFTRRLKQFLLTGAHARYDWRREFDGSIELEATPEAAWAGLLAPGRPAAWLPIEESALVRGSHLLVENGQETTRLEIADLLAEPPSRLQFKLVHPSWRRATSCRLTLEERGGGALLCARHVGWEAISPQRAIQQGQRERFSRLWIEALRRAAQAVRMPDSVVPSALRPDSQRGSRVV